MALNLAKFKTDLKAALLTAQKKNQVDNLTEDPKDAPEAAMGNLADELAKVIDAYIKTATVSTSVSTTVTGTCVTPAGGGAGTIAGAGTGTGTGSLS